MFAAWIAGALVFGLIVWRMGLPPLVGFLLSGFVFSAFGAEASALLGELAHAGVLLLLFAVGLKLRFETLFRYEVWGTALAHLLLLGAAAGAALVWFAGWPWLLAAAAAAALGFSSTVFAAKVLETHRELRAVHGRVAVGILIVQDLVAVAVLAALSVRGVSPWAPLLLLLPLLRPLAARLLDSVDHGELLVLLGAVLAIAVGGAGFEQLGVSPELGALLLGTMLAGHRRAQELGNALWGLKEFLLVGFFLNIGLGSAPSWDSITAAAALAALLPVKAGLFFALLLLLGLRARTSFLAAVSLASYSEFGLIVVAAAVGDGLLDPHWLVVAALAVALSFLISAPVNVFAHRLFARAGPWLQTLERAKRHPDDEPMHFGSAEILIVGMGRVGTGAYDFLRERKEAVVGMDSDPGKLQRHRAEGRRVVYADAEDAGFWQSLHFGRLRAVMLALPDVEAKRLASRELRRRGFTGLVSATHVYPEERPLIVEAGCDVTYNYFTEAGVGFARDTWAALTADGGDTEP
jgi:predicted Kef-type K+ transport protein